MLYMYLLQYANADKNTITPKVLDLYSNFNSNEKDKSTDFDNYIKSNSKTISKQSTLNNHEKQIRIEDGDYFENNISPRDEITQEQNKIDDNKVDERREKVADSSSMRKNCQDDNYCLNGGTCVLSESGQMLCLCPESFYGSRCQTRNICKTIIIDSMTGDLICSKIGRECMKNDKFLRCICDEDEYFMFKIFNQPLVPENPTNSISNGNSKSFPSTRSANLALPTLQPISTTKTFQHSTSTASLVDCKGNDLNGNQQQTSIIQQTTYCNISTRTTTMSTSSPTKPLEMVQRASSFPSDKDELLSDRLNANYKSDSINNNEAQSQQQQQQQSYIAECRKIDKCLGVRCKQLSEVCKDGQCVCNQDAGYMRDPFDNKCKLLDPCKMPTEDGKPICGQAQCVATYDQELYKCICPLGYQALRVSSHRNSTVCTILRNLICRVPLLNKCQHICEIENANNSYKCSCLRGYKPGNRPGIDDHMCFFIKQVDDPFTEGYNDYLNNEFVEEDVLNSNNNNNDHNNRDRLFGGGSGRLASNSDEINNYEYDDDDDDYEYKAYPIPKSRSPSEQNPPSFSSTSGSSTGKQLTDTFTYDPLTTTKPFEQPTTVNSLSDSLSLEDFEAEDIPQRFKSDEIYIKRERRNFKPNNNDKNKSTKNTYYQRSSGSSTNTSFANENYSDSSMSHNNNEQHKESNSNNNHPNLPKLSAQERCNMYCEENKICELEDGSTDSYRCVCNRQGYVSIGDRCLDWCAAADFEWQLRGLLDYTCWSGNCKPHNQHPILTYAAKLAAGEQPEESESSRLERESSWRPTFECDCSNSPLLLQDPITKLCKFNFEAALEPCKPGNVGYIDCVENKNAYCAVLYKQHKQFISEHQRERFYKNIKTMPQASSSSSSSSYPTGGSSPLASGQPALEATSSPFLNNKQANPFSSNGNTNQNKANYNNIKQTSTSGSSKMANEKMYTCLCSPEKKFLVDKPRNKQRCVDECDLLNIECGRFNRMCRSATIAPDDFGKRNLVRIGPDGVRMNFKRTGCECLPGFNVGPSESVDLTVEDNPSYSSNANLDTNNINQDSNSILIDDYLIPINNNEINNINFDQDQSEKARAKYININSRCLLDYDVVEFHASFKIPFDFDPNWIKINNNNFMPQIKTIISPSSRSSSSSMSNDKSVRQETSKEELINPGNSLRDKKNTSGEVKENNINDSFDSLKQEGIESEARDSTNGQSSINNQQQHQQDQTPILNVPDFMFTDINELHKRVVLVAQCDPSLMPISVEAFQECVKYRYWIVQKLRNHFVDWRRVVTGHLKETFDLMEGNVRVRVNKCNATLKSVLIDTSSPNYKEKSFSPSQSSLVVDANQQQKQQVLNDKSGKQQQQQFNNNDNNTTIVLTPQANAMGTSIINSNLVNHFNLLDQQTTVDGYLNCELTLHSASDDFSPRYARKVLLEKQLHKFIFPIKSPPSIVVEQQQSQEGNNEKKTTTTTSESNNSTTKEQSKDLTPEREIKTINGINEEIIKEYYLMAPHMLIKRDSFDQLAKHRKEFNPCKSNYAYCEKQTRCEMVDTVNYTCTCEYGYTPIGSRDIYYADSRKEVCEDINECLFDVCKKLANVSTCINEIGDYRCQCNRHYIGDNKRYCNHVCSTISCKHGKCRLVDDHHAFCECDEGYKDTDCSVQDPNVALRKANMIICGSIFTSVLLLAITFAISLSSQLRKTKKKLKRLEAANEAVSAGGLFELSNQQPLRPRLSFLYLILLF